MDPNLCSIWIFGSNLSNVMKMVSNIFLIFGVNDHSVRITFKRIISFVDAMQLPLFYS